MKTVNSFFSLLLFILLVSCNKNEMERKIPLLVASQEFNELNRLKKEFIVYSDSTYIFKEEYSEANHNKTERWEGKVEINNNIIKFTPFTFDYNGSETAILKNGFVEFADGKFPDRMKIVQTSLSIKNNLDLKNFKDYAVFTFYKNHHNSTWKKEVSNYDTNTNELVKIDSILKKEFETNKKLKKYNNYLKQVVAVKNSKNEILIMTHFFCKNRFLTETYLYQEISMMDGGNCNVYIELNLTTEKLISINIAGMA